MTFTIDNIDDQPELQSVSCLVYGMPNTGKTYCIRTAPKPFLLDVEHNLDSLRGSGIAMKRIDSSKDFAEARAWLDGSDEAKQYETIAIDSITKLSELYLKEFEAQEKSSGKSPNAWLPYSKLQEVMSLLFGWAKTSSKHVYMTGGIEIINDPLTGREVFVPSFAGKAPWKKASRELSEIWLLRKSRGTSEGEYVHKLLTDGVDTEFIAKSHCNVLPYEVEPNLTDIFNRILNHKERR